MWFCSCSSSSTMHPVLQILCKWGPQYGRIVIFWTGLFAIEALVPAVVQNKERKCRKKKKKKKLHKWDNEWFHFSEYETWVELKKTWRGRGSLVYGQSERRDTPPLAVFLLLVSSPTHPLFFFSSAVEIVGCEWGGVWEAHKLRSVTAGRSKAGRRADDPGTEKRHLDKRGETRKKETVQVIQEKSGRRPGGSEAGWRIDR